MLLAPLIIMALLPFSVIAEMEYWKTPSRRLYVAKRAEYEDLVKEKEKSV